MSKSKKILVSFFILFNFMTMIRIHLPIDYKFFSSIYRPIDFYLSFFSIYQDWMMFSPNPSRNDIFLSAEIEFLDGSKDHFYFPKSSDLKLGEKYFFGEKYRKLMSEVIAKNPNNDILKDVAKFVLRKVKIKNFNKIPLKIHLIKHWVTTENIYTKFIPHHSKNLDIKKSKFFTYEVI